MMKMTLSMVVACTFCCSAIAQGSPSIGAQNVALLALSAKLHAKAACLHHHAKVRNKCEAEALKAAVDAAASLNEFRPDGMTKEAFAMIIEKRASAIN